MNFPTEMTLKRFPEGLRICRQPVREISKLHDKEHRFTRKAITPGENLLAGISGGLLHIQAEIEPGQASAFGFKALGEAVTYSVKDHTLTCLGKTAAVEPEGGRIRLQILVDRTSIEVFANGGRAVMSSCFVPKTDSSQLECFAEGGAAKAVSLKAHTLKSAWR
jgi:levanase/fructan beta-fructosidase